MRILTYPVFLGHDTGDHPECRERLQLFELEMRPDLPETSEDLLHLVHDTGYVRRIAATDGQQTHWLDGDTVISAGTYQAALHAAGAAVEAARHGLLALVRPPGHHAYRSRGSGFCVFNNMAIAAEFLRRQGKRVLVFDFDGHYGDGTSAIFESVDEVLFISLHQHPAFPYCGANDRIGEGKGRGFNVPVTLPAGAGDDIFIHAIHNYAALIEQFEPDVVAVSAGFDAHWQDPLLQLRLSTSCYYEIGLWLRGLGLPVFGVLEGGYQLQVLAPCVYNFVAGVNGSTQPFAAGHTTSDRRTWEAYDIDLFRGMSVLSPYWRF